MSKLEHDNCLYKNIRLNLIIAQEYDTESKSIKYINNNFKLVNNRTNFVLIISGMYNPVDDYKCIAFLRYLENEEGIKQKSMMKLLEIDLTSISNEILPENVIGKDIKKIKTTSGHHRLFQVNLMNDVPSKGKGLYEIMLYAEFKEPKDDTKPVLIDSITCILN